VHHPFLTKHSEAIIAANRGECSVSTKYLTAASSSFFLLPSFLQFIAIAAVAVATCHTQLGR
jgi:hypothetical protein